MSGTKRKTQIFRRIEPYWYVIAALIMGGAYVLINHLLTGQTPNRVAIHVAPLDFDVFWYGIFIIGGVALGSYVTARLAAERANELFDETVPQKLQGLPTTRLDLPAEIQSTLARQKLYKVGQLLYRWGLDHRQLGLKPAGQEEVRQRLEKVPGIDEDWLEDAPWRQWNPDYVWGGITWILVLAIIGARLYHVLTPSPSMAAVGITSALDYFRNPMQLINLRSGGLGIFGGIAGGALGLFLYTRRHSISAIAWADIGVVGLALGQSIGRWGNFFNQELYGRPSELPWAIYIDPVHRLDQYLNVSRYHPAFIYESLWSLLSFAILLLLARKRRSLLLTGDLMALYLVLYSVGRILLELIRLDSLTLSLGGIDLGIPVATLVSIIIAIPMAALLIWRHVIHRQENAA
jgi:phosphatidylglycerol:prolipoprotein diacylglycerol transferase